jgi:exodeoxyribonuclease-3
MRVMTLNLLLGGQERLPGLLALLARVRPDVLVLQECLGWDEDRLASAAAALELPADPLHARLALARPRPSGARYHLALLSRWPIVRFAVHADPAIVGHAILDAQIDTPGGAVRVLGAHFDSHGEDLRVREAELVRELCPPAVLREGRCLLAGDLNALARHDPWPDDLGARLAAAGIRKYGLPPRFDAMDLLLDAGWVDLLQRRAPGAAWATAIRGPVSAPIPTRTDYLLASPALADELRAIEVVDVGNLSDHHGLLASFETSP